jgi:Fe-S-cluster containining protein
MIQYRSWKKAAGTGSKPNVFPAIPATRYSMKFSELPEKQQLCIACCKCCREVGIYTHPGMYSNTKEEVVEFYRARGFNVTESGDLLIISLKMACPHLTPAGCDIYENRPQVCKDYSGLNDFKTECFWSGLPENRR